MPLFYGSAAEGLAYLEAAIVHTPAAKRPEAAEPDDEPDDDT